LYGLSDPRDGVLRVIGRSVMPHQVTVLDGLEPGGLAAGWSSHGADQ
jgi:hypothetical protein